MKSIFLVMIFSSVLAVAGELEEVLVPPNGMITPDFHEGAELGPGVVERDIYSDPPLAAAPKAKTRTRTRVAGELPKKSSVSTMVAPAAPSRSIASYPDDRKFSNQVIQGVREKDHRDYEETLSIVKSAILRGDYGEAARLRLKNATGSDSGSR